MEQQANALCGTDTECLFDVAATGRVDIGEAAVEIGREIEEILELQIPGIHNIELAIWPRFGRLVRCKTYLTS